MVVYMVVAQHCQLLILGCDTAQACCLQVSCVFGHRHACQEQAQTVRIDPVKGHQLQLVLFANTTRLTISI